MKNEDIRGASEAPGLQLYDNLDGQGQGMPEIFKRLPVRLPYIMALYCQRGEISLMASLHNYTLREGQLLICINETVVSAVRMSEECRMFCLCLSKDHQLEAEIPKAIGYFVGEINARPLRITIPEHFREPYLELYRLLRQWVIVPDFRLRRQAIVGTFQTMMSLSASTFTGPEGDIGQPTSQPQLLYRRFITLVAQHYREHRELAFYADRLCITPKYLSRLVFQVSERRAAEIVRDYVVLDAKALLLSGRYSIGQVAEELHFATPSFFSAYFRHATGTSPTEYRN